MSTRAPCVALAAGAAVSAALLTGGLAVASAASAATQTTVVQGEVIRLVSSLDTAAASAMTTGFPVSWDVAVSAARPDGVIDLRIDGAVPSDAFTVTVRSCAVEWTPTGCATGAQTLAAGTAAAPLPLPRRSADAPGWYRIDVALERAEPGATATLEFRAIGMGSDPAPSMLPVTGGVLAPLFVPAIGAILLGLAVAGISRWHRRYDA